MDSKKIKSLLTAVEHGSLTSAAQELGYTQSGLTHMMNALEEELGLSLLIRRKTGVHLSAAGQELLASMHDFLDAADALERRAAQIRERNSSMLRVGAYSSIARQWLPAILSNFRSESPETDVSITMASVSGIYEQVKSGALDCAIVSYQSALCQGLLWVPLRSDELMAILPDDYDGGRESFPVEGFARQDFLMPGNDFDMDIMPAFSAPGRKVLPRIRYTNLEDDMVASMVEHRLGISVLSELIMQGIRDRVCALPLDPPCYRQLGMIVNDINRNERNIRRFLSCAENTIAAMYGG